MSDTVTILQHTTDTLGALSALIDVLSDIIPKTIALAAGLSAILPPPEQSSSLARLHKIINTLAFNFGHAKNATKDDE